MRVQGMIRLVAFGLLAMLPTITGQGKSGLALVTDGSEGEDLQAATIRRMEEESLNITKDTLKKIQAVIVLQDEGIIYCPIPKVSSSEWKRALCWMNGDKDWNNHNRYLHKKEVNGLELLADRGLEETRWAFESDSFTRFVIVRNPAERLVSAFLNKCIHNGIGSVSDNGGHFAKKGALNCNYLEIMPELFPNTELASLDSQARLNGLVEADPEDTFYHFASGIWRQAEAHHGGACKVLDTHFRPQACFCDLPNLLPAFHVMAFSNMSAEAEAFAGRLPAALSSSSKGGGAELGITGVDGAGAMMTSYRKTGVDEARREEIHKFLVERFIDYHKTATTGITKASENKGDFLSERVMEIIEKMYKVDYDLLGDYV